MNGECIGACGRDCNENQGRDRCEQCPAWPRHDADGHQHLRDLAVAVAMVAAAITVVVFTPEIVGWVLGAL